MYRVEIFDIYGNEIHEHPIDSFSFTVGTGMNGGDIEAVCDIDVIDRTNQMIQCAIYNDNNSVVAYGILTRKTIDFNKQKTNMYFSGVPALLRGAILTPHPLLGYDKLNSGVLAYKIKAGTKLGVINNMLCYTQNKISPSGTANYTEALPFLWGRAQSSGTAYVYNLYNGDFKVLADVISEYIERENVPAFRWTYQLVQANSLYPESKIGSVNFSQITTQTTPITLATRALIELSPVSFDASNTLNTAILSVNVDEGGTQKVMFYGQGQITSGDGTPLNTVGMVQGHENVTDMTTLKQYAQGRANQLTSASCTVKLQQRYGTQWHNYETFSPLDIGKIVYFPVLPATENRREPWFLYGVVTEAKYENNDTVTLTLNNVRMQNTQTLDIALMNRQTSTPKTVTNLLNTLNNNLGSQSAKPKI